MQVRIGLEIHEQLKTREKLFCRCSADYRNAEPNTNICPICTAQPGAKPMGINKRALESMVKIALALNCKINKYFLFRRKHYFYPDLPNNYQRTTTPIGTNGKLGDVKIKEVHLEEDPGRYDLKRGLVDYNRSGVPLIEIVTEPDMHSPEEAREFLKKLESVLSYLDVCREEEGTMRIDANISLGGGNRVEIKNINSFSGVYKALKYEIMRQRNLIKQSIEIKRETRHFDEDQGITISLREKETAEDYRYIPDPDLPPVEISEKFIKNIKATLPELPEARISRIVMQYGIERDVAEVLASDKELADIFEDVAKIVDAKIAAYWLKNQFKKILNLKDLRAKDVKAKPEKIAEVLLLYKNGDINEMVTKQLLQLIVENPNIDPKTYVKDKGLAKITDEDMLREAVKKIIIENKKAVEDYLAGERKAINYLAGKVMQATRGKAEPRIVMKLLQKELEALKT